MVNTQKEIKKEINNIAANRRRKKKCGTKMRIEEKENEEEKIFYLKSTSKTWEFYEKQ